MVVIASRGLLLWFVVAFSNVAACSVASPPASEPGEVPRVPESTPAPKVSRCVALPWPEAAPGTQSAASGCHELPVDTQREVGAVLEREVRGRDDGLVVKVDFPCTAIEPTPASIVGVRVAGHGGATRVVEIKRANDGRFVIRTMKAVPRLFDDKTLSTPSPTFSQSELPEAVVMGAFVRIRTALAARVVTERKPLPANQVGLGPIELSDDLKLIEIRLRDARGVAVDRRYAGYVGNVKANERVPVQLAWQALEAVLPAATPRDSADSNDRVLLRTIWAGSASTTWYGEQGLLALATSAGSQELITPITRALGNPSPFTRGLAVSALAAITGWDARRDESGAVRPLEAVVADYQRECARP